MPGDWNRQDVALVCEDFLDALQGIKDSLDDADTDLLVEVGVSLSRLSTELDDVLDRAKTLLRARAKQRKGPGETNIYLGEGSSKVRVAFPNPARKLRADADLVKLRRVFGVSYDAFFDEKTTVTPKKGAEDRLLKEGTTLQIKAFMEAVDSVDQTPRVSFNPPSR